MCRNLGCTTGDESSRRAQVLSSYWRLALLCAIAGCGTILAGCEKKGDGGETKKESAEKKSAEQSKTSDEKESKKRAEDEAAANVETGGNIEIKHESATDGKSEIMKVGKAFAHLVDDDGTTKLANIVLYNEGAGDLDCDSNLYTYKDDNLVGGSNLAVLLRGKKFMEVEFGKSMEIGRQYSPCLWYTADYGDGPQQKNSCGFSQLSGDDVRLTNVTKNKIEGEINVESSISEDSVRGGFTAEVCPTVKLDAFLKDR